MDFEVKSIDYQDCKEWFLKKHYAHRIPSVSYCFGLFDKQELIGVCSFGMPPSSTLAESICGVKFKDLVLELNRLIVNDNLPKNSLSFFVSKSINLLPKPKIIVSFSDLNQSHYGYIYQATNFIFTGESSNTFQYIDKFGNEFHFRNLGHYQKNNKLNVDLIKKRKNEESINRFEIANFLKVYKGNYTYKKLDEIFGYKDTCSHWFRTDAGFSFPNIDDWIKLKSILNFDNRFDDIMTDFEMVADVNQIIKKLELKKIEIKPKLRYIYFLCNKFLKKELLKELKYNIQPYPKGENKRYDASYKPTTQNKLF